MSLHQKMEEISFCWKQEPVIRRLVTTWEFRNCSQVLKSIIEPQASIAINPAQVPAHIRFSFIRNPLAKEWSFVSGHIGDTAPYTLIGAGKRFRGILMTLPVSKSKECPLCRANHTPSYLRHNTTR